MFDLFVIRAHIALDCLCERLRAVLRNKRGEIELPDYVLSDLARAFLADIIGFFAQSEHQAVYEEWQKKREQHTTKKTTKKP